MMRFIVLVFLTAVSPGEHRVQAADLGTSWSSINKCAVNSLYLYLQFNHCEASYSAIEEELNIVRDGVSLASMRDHATRFGAPSTVVKLTPQTIADYGLPIIAHLEAYEANTGHYVVVVSRSGDYIDVIDGTSGKRSTMTLAAFCKKWSGYAMVLTSRGFPLGLFVCLLGFCIGMVDIAWASVARRRRRASILAVLLATSTIGLSRDAVGEEPSRIADAMDAQWSAVTQMKVHYTLTTKALADEPEVVRILGVEFLVEADRTYAFKGGARYFEQIEHVTPLMTSPGAGVGGPLKKHNLYTYDGTASTFRYMDKIIGAFASTSLDNPNYTSDQRIFNQEFLLRIGRPVPDFLASRRQDAPLTPTLSNRIRAGGFRLAGTAVVDGLSCARLEEVRGDVTESFWVSPKLGYAIVKREVRKAGVGPPASVTSMRNHRLLASGVYIPYTITTDHYFDAEKGAGSSNMPLLQAVLSVEECTTNSLPDSMFLYDPPPGTPALGDVGGKRVAFNVPATREHLDTVLQEMETAGRVQAVWKWIGILLAVVLACLAAAATFRFRASRRRAA